MPKEYVACNYDAVDERGNRVDFNTFRVKVGWSREAGHVQIATIDPEKEEVFDATSRDGGLYVDLDRRGINDLIRLLRKARDQAFGRDE